jgi:hypothetical protein
VKDIELELDDQTARGSARTALYLIAVALIASICAVWMTGQAIRQFLTGEW